MTRKLGPDHTRVLVCGGCEFEDLEYLVRKLDNMHAKNPFGMIIEGDAVGADEMAGLWADARGVPLARVRPAWKFYGKEAWWRRNLSMLQLQPTRVIAFPGGGGTAHMVRNARAAGVDTLVIKLKHYEREQENYARAQAAKLARNAT